MINFSLRPCRNSLCPEGKQQRRFSSRRTNDIHQRTRPPVENGREDFSHTVVLQFSERNEIEMSSQPRRDGISTTTEDEEALIGILSFSFALSYPGGPIAQTKLMSTNVRNSPTTLRSYQPLKSMYCRISSIGG